MDGHDVARIAGPVAVSSLQRDSVPPAARMSRVLPRIVVGAAVAKNDRRTKFQQSNREPTSRVETKAQPKKDVPPPQTKKLESPLQPALSLADKIRLLQEKFSGIR